MRHITISEEIKRLRERERKQSRGYKNKSFLAIGSVPRRNFKLAIADTPSLLFYIVLHTPLEILDTTRAVFFRLSLSLGLLFGC